MVREYFLNQMSGAIPVIDQDFVLVLPFMSLVLERKEYRMAESSSKAGAVRKTPKMEYIYMWISQGRE